MANFKGYLLKAIKNGTVFPHRLMQFETWETQPKQREEIKAYRDDNTRALTRVTAEGMKTAIKFTTMDDISLAEKEEIVHFFTENESNSKERKIELEYWNDDDCTYETGTFYRANPSYKIKSIEKDNIYYSAFDVELIEY